MKKLLRIGSALLALMLLLSVTVLAADPPKEAGIYGVTLASGYESIPFKVLRAEETATAAGITAEAAEIDGVATQFYPEGVKVWFEIAVPEGFNLVLGLNEDEAPTEQNIEYIDQQTTADGKVAFTVYPKSASGQVIVKLANAEGVKKVLSFKLYQAYMLGDVDDNKAVNATDALWVLQYAAHSRELSGKELLAANVTKDAAVNATDALWILQYAAHTRTF